MTEVDGSICQHEVRHRVVAVVLSRKLDFGLGIPVGIAVLVSLCMDGSSVNARVLCVLLTHGGWWKGGNTNI